MNILIMFFFYSFIGWILEVGYAFYKKGRFINRGFLFMPFVPIYGLSAIFLHASVYSLFYTFDPLNIVHLLTVFVMIGIISTSLELLGGALLLKLFEIRWWDYSHLPYNFKGFVALKFSLLWSIVGMILFAFLHHLIVNPYIDSLSFETKSLIAAPLVFIFVLDWTYAVVSLINVKKYIHELKNNVETIFEKSETLSSSLQPEKLKTLRANLHILVKQFRRHEYVSFIRSKIEQIKLQVTDIEKHSEETREPVDRLKRISNKLSKFRLFKVFPEIKVAIKNKRKDHVDNGKNNQ